MVASPGWEGAIDGLISIGKQLIDELDADPSRPGLKETPKRWAKYMMAMTEGNAGDPATILKTFEDGAEKADELIHQGPIPFYSLCEHHLAPFFGVVHIGYIPDGRILGLSKFARLIEIFARRLQVQERLTAQIADTLWDHLKPEGVAVVIRARHMCMESRGVERMRIATSTSALRGSLKVEPEARAEFFKFVELAEAGSPPL